MNLDGDAVAVWLALSSSQYQVRSAMYRAGSATWNTPVTIGASGSSPQVAIDPHGNATAVWQVPGSSVVQAARYTTVTGVWTAAVNVTPHTSNGTAAQPRVVMDSSGHATAIFWNGVTTERALSASRWPAGSASWSHPEALLAADASTPLPTPAVDAAGNVLVVSGRPYTSTSGVAAARYVAATGVWSDTHTLSDVGSDPQVVVDGAGNATVVWVGYQVQGSGTTIISSSYSASSDTWSSPQPLFTNSSGNASPPGLAVDGTGTVTAVWSRYDPASRQNLRSAARRGSGQPWTGTVALADGVGLSFAAASASGDVTVLWSDLRSTRWASGGAEAVSAPIALTVTTPTIWNGQAQVGAPLRISWSAPQTGLPVTGYRLEAGSSPGASDLAVLDVGAATEVVTTVPLLRRVDLRVRAISEAIVGPPSNETGFLVYGVCSAPSVPSALTDAVSGSTATFTWQATSDAATYVLEAGTAPGLANLVSMNIGSATHFSANAPPGVYYVRVRAENSCGTSGTSNEVVVTIGGAPAPGAPVLNTPVVSGNTVSVTWSAGSGGTPTAYTLTASVTPGGAPVATVPLSGTSASFPGVPPGTYYLRLTATNVAGTSPPAQVTLNVP